MDSQTIQVEHVYHYLTEYSRFQLSKEEKKQVEEHLEQCSVCKYEAEVLTKLSSELDKLIPVVSNNYKKAFIYNLFIVSRNESIFVKGIAIVFITILTMFILSSGLKIKGDYISINDLKERSQNLFNETFYSNQK
jgi:hypothetical protein